MIVSNARALKEYSDLTSDLPALLGALDRLEKDPAQVEVAPTQEAGWLDALERMVDDTTEGVREEIVGRQREDTRRERAILRSGGETARAKAEERGQDQKNLERNLALESALQRIAVETEYYVSEERRRVEKSLDRLADFLGNLLDLDPPKTLLYFADTIRSNAGAHYREELRSLPSAKTLLNGAREGSARIYTTWADPSVTPEAGAYMDRAINAADASGIRLYTVQAEGLVESSSAVRDAQDTLSGLALETGGRAFLNGATADRIAKGIREDLACLYRISFDPVGLRVDRPLAVLVTVDRPEVTVQVRGRLVVQSESERLVSRLLASSLSPEKETGNLPIRVAAIPAGMDGGRYLGLVQVAVLADGRRSGRWQLGASLMSGGSVRESSAGLIQASAAGMPVVLEEMLKIPPGAHEILALVHEVESGQIGTKRLQGEWPDPDRASACIVPAVLLQFRDGAFARDKQTRTSGLLALAPEDPVDPSRPVVLVTLVCRGKREKEPLQVERKLTGESSVDFPALRVEFGNDRCAQVRDVVPGNTLGGGGFRYVVRALAAGQELTASERPFWVADREPARGQ